MKLPSSWEEVYVDQYIELVAINNKDISFFQKQLEVLAILTDTLPDDEIWQDLDVDDLDDYIDSIKWVMKEPSNNFSKLVNGLTIIDINKLSLGEYIDLDNLFVDNVHSNLTKICAILYKKINEDKWGNIEYEPYGKYDLDLRAELFEEVSIANVYGVIDYFLIFKERIHSIYELLFEPDLSGLDEPEYDETNEEEKKEIENEERFKKWSWEMLLHKLSNGDITKYDTITELPVIFIFNQMSFIKDMELDKI